MDEIARLGFIDRRHAGDLQVGSMEQRAGAIQMFGAVAEIRAETEVDRF
jgi:hypothetical protein